VRAGHWGCAMPAEMIIGLVVLGVVVLVLLVGVVLPKLVYRFMEGPLEARIAAHYRPDEVLLKDLKANSFGLESAGVWQGRGNGGLVLTGKYLHFFRFWPEAEHRIPLDAITEVTFTKSHLGKATVFDLLKVRFVVDGKADSIAWYLTDPPAWKRRIEELRAGA
jgi:hypothetical protein